MSQQTSTNPQHVHGRATVDNPRNRFVPLEVVRDVDAWVDPDNPFPSPATEFFRDATRSIISRNDSPDVGFEHSINPYRGCEHGCIYCYARPTHEYLGFSAGLDFETKIMVKEDAPELLRAELMSPKWQPQMLAISGVTDCYQPIERKMRLTRRCLEVLVEFRNPVGIVTKNFLVTRDIDLLKQLAAVNTAAVFVSITTLDPALTRVMEPRTSVPARRLAAMEAVAAAGIPVGLLMAPVIPGLNDHEIPAVVNAAKNAGATTAGYVPLRLPYGLAPLFEDWLARNFPDRKEKVLNRIRSMRSGKLNDSNFNTRMHGVGPFAEHISAMFELAKKRAGLADRAPRLSTDAFRRPAGAQMQLWS
jgi:DNA repair photolyase